MFRRLLTEKISLDSLAPTVEEEKKIEKKQLLSEIGIQPSSPKLRKKTTIKRASPKTEKIQPPTPEQAMVSPMTPKINEEKEEKEEKEIPMSPSVGFDSIESIKNSFSFEEKLKKYRYIIRNYIIDKKKNIALYAVCSDSYGAIVYISLDVDNISMAKGITSIFIEETDEANLSYAYKESIKSKMSHEIYGLILHSDCEYVTMIREDDGSITTSNYTSCDSNQKVNTLPRVYAILKFSEIINNQFDALKRTKNTYSIIQSQQIKLNKDTEKTLADATEKLIESMKSFDFAYKENSAAIVGDYETLSKYAEEYFTRYLESSLGEKEEEMFTNTSNNMFYRFQKFNQQCELINSLFDISTEVLKCVEKIEDITNKLNKETEKMNGTVIDEDDINVNL